MSWREFGQRAIVNFLMKRKMQIFLRLPIWIAVFFLLAWTAKSFQSSTGNSAAVPTAQDTLRFFAVGEGGRPVTDLKPEELRLRINKSERKILSLESVRREARTIGLFFDNSLSHGADKHKREEVEAVGRFLESIWRASDTAFALGFNDRPFVLVQPTNKLQEIRDALNAVISWNYHGSTALYDALCAPARKGNGMAKEDLIYIVLSDFEDNSSKQSKDKALQTLEQESARIFPILLSFEPVPSQKNLHRARAVARQLADQTGGELLEVTSVNDIQAMFARLAVDIDSEYQLRYETATPLEIVKDLRVESARPRTRLLYAKKYFPSSL
jgi:VWFA-related protein